MPDTYRIRPLVWEEFGGNCRAVRAETPVGRYLIISDCLWTPDNTRHEPLNSLELAKSAAEAHYRERIGQALEVVT